MDDIKKLCLHCNTVILHGNKGRKYCNIKCKRAYHRIHGCESTERQYKNISGNWNRYLARLCNRSFKRQNLHINDVLKLLESQQYKCALSGVELTCKLEKGVICKTNASIDRINPKGEYNIDNVQLVCVALNKLRTDTEMNEFIEWCRKVTEYNAIQK